MADWWDRHFKSEYDQDKKALKDSKSFAASWQPVAADLFQLMGDEGLDAGRESALARLRRKATEGEVSTVGTKAVQVVTEDTGLLSAVGANGSAIGDVPKARAAALKFLRHTYLLNRSGNNKVWVHSLPLSFSDWPSHALAAASTPEKVKELLRSSDERFSADDKKNLATSVQQAMAWCQKAGILLASAAAGGTPPSAETTAARALVKRWFVGEDTVTEGDVNGLIATLTLGFKALIAAVGRGHFVLTDFVPLRKATGAEERKFFGSEAFTLRSRYEGMDVVYVEDYFFKRDPGGVIFDQANWTRIVVHELSHLICGTDDFDDRYAHSGIGVHAGFPSTKAVNCADSWAFFAADCAGILTAGNRLKALAKR
jgi:hypothetical protein